MESSQLVQPEEIKRVVLKLELNNQISNIIETIAEYGFILNSRAGNAQLKIYIKISLFAATTQRGERTPHF